MLWVIPSYCALQVARAIANWIENDHVAIRSVTIHLSSFTRIHNWSCIDCVLDRMEEVWWCVLPRKQKKAKSVKVKARHDSLQNKLAAPHPPLS